MNGDTRQRTLLIVLGVLLLIVVWRYLRPIPEADETPPLSRPSGGIEDAGEASARPLSASSGERRGARPGDRVAVLRMADLDRVPPDSVAGRDPWRFVDPPPPLPPPPPPPPTAEQLRQMEEARRRAAEAARLAAIEAAKPRPAEFTMEYLGNFGPPDKKIAVFNDGKKIYNALQGDVIDNKFIVARIGYESVDIGFVGFPDWPVKRLGVRRQ